MTGGRAGSNSVALLFDTQRRLRYNVCMSVFLKLSRGVDMPRLVAVAFCLAAVLTAPSALCEVASAPEAPAVAEPAEEQNVQTAEDADGPDKPTANEHDADAGKNAQEEEANDDAYQPEGPATDEQNFVGAIEALVTGNIGRAYFLFEILAEQTQDKELAADAAKYLEGITDAGKKEIKEVLALENPAEASAKLRALYREYWTTPLRQKLISARQQIQVRLAQKAALNVEEGGGGEISEDDKDARMWLIVGDIHRMNGRKQQAREAYDVLVYEHPDSRFTDQARDRIELLRIADTIEAPREKGGDE